MVSLREIKIQNDNAKIVIGRLISAVRGYKEAHQNIGPETWVNRGVVDGSNWKLRKEQLAQELVAILVENEELLAYFQNILYSQFPNT